MSVDEAIAAHKAACAAHEAVAVRFDKWDGIDRLPQDYVAYGQTWAKEVAAFRKMVRARCMSAADVQAKLNHVLNGTPKHWEAFISCMSDLAYSGDTDCIGLMAPFLKSLVIRE